MSGFSPDWLALREPADHAAVNPDVRNEVIALLADRASVRITDLGCGTGSNLRGLSPALGDRQAWRLVDYDRKLLEAARRSLAGWADSATQDNGELHLRCSGKALQVSLVEADLASGLDAVLDRPADIITCAAFFDLVSPQWLVRFSEALAARRLPLYGVLTYDGIQRWRPPHPLDMRIANAFNAHQGGDKGFGPAAGPNAVRLLCEALEGRGYRVVTGISPWTLGQDQRALLGELVDGIAGAALETGQVEKAEAGEWCMARHDALSGEIGHTDIFACPA